MGKTKKIVLISIISVLAIGVVIWASLPSDKAVNSSTIVERYVGDLSDVASLEGAKLAYTGNEPSDITGYTKEEKTQMGLNPVDGSDTDMDGLTDKEEIEEYGSDPLKPSTADDLYTDKYKIENGMDVHKYYEYDKESVFSINDVPEISFTAVSPLDFKASAINNTEYLDDYIKYESSRKINYSDVYRIYSINGYSNNTFSIDTTAIEKSDEDDLTVYVFESNNNAPLKNTSVKNNNGTLTIKLAAKMSPLVLYKVFVCKDRSIVGTITDSFNSSSSNLGTFNDDGELSSVKTEEENDKYKSLIVAKPFFTLLSGAKPIVYISKNASEDQIKDTILMANAIYEDSRPKWGYYVGKREVTREDCYFIDEDSIKKNTDIRYGLLGPAYICLGLVGDNMFFYCYTPYEAYAQQYHKERAEYNEQKKNFSHGDKFCFDNFDTKYYEGVDHGNCAGIAWVAALIHDNDGLSTLSGSYYSKLYQEELSYSLDESSQENMTLLDRYISDYKADKFGGVASLNPENLNEVNPLPNFDNTTLTEDEVEFTKLISAYWAEYNDNIARRDIAINGFLSNKDHMYLDWETVENMKSSLDNKRTLIWSFNLGNKYGKGHAVNITGYHQYGDTVVFDVYDNNYPFEPFELRCEKITSSRGDESFEYKYETKFKEDYTTSFDFKDDTQIKGLTDEYVDGDALHRFYVFDSDLNLLNVPLEI